MIRLGMVATAAPLALYRSDTPAPTGCHDFNRRAQKNPSHPFQSLAQNVLTTVLYCSKEQLACAPARTEHTERWVSCAMYAGAQPFCTWL